MPLNQYRITGDFLHGFAILILIFHIIRSRSCHSVSGITVILYAITFSGRYLDLYPVFLSMPEGLFVYNTIFKVYYLASHYLLLALIYGVFRNTRDRTVNTFPIFGYLIFAHLLTWGLCSATNLSYLDKEFFWRYSIFLEIFAIIPQLSLIHKQGTISQAMTYYVTMLGTYRALYIANWIRRYHDEQFWEPIAFFCGGVQTIIYLYFFVVIYPQLNKTKVATEVINSEETKEDLIRKMNNDVPLIHNIV